MFAIRFILLASTLALTLNVAAQPETKSADPQQKPRWNKCLMFRRRVSF